MNQTTHNPTKSESFTIYNQLRAALRRAGNEKAIHRLNKALGILQSKNYYNQAERENYFPTVNSCGCKDWEYRFSNRRKYTGPCKHMLANQMLAMIEARRKEHDIAGWLELQAEHYSLTYSA